MSATAVLELSANEAEQLVAVEPEAIVAEPAPAPIETTPTQAQTPAVEQAKPVEQQPKTASEQAYGHDELSSSERDHLIHMADSRIAAAAQPFLLACSNRKEALHAHANNPKLTATLGKIAFGEMLPGVSKPNLNAGLGMPEGAAKLVGKSALKSGGMKKTLERIGKIPMLNFNVNYPAHSAAETAEDYVDNLGDSVETANEAMRVGLEGRSNEDLAALVAAFDPKANHTSTFQDHIDHALAKLVVEPKNEEEKEIEEKPAKELAAAGDPEEAKKHEKLQAEREEKQPEGATAQAEKQDKLAERSVEEEQVAEKVPDEMRELYDDRAYNRV